MLVDLESNSASYWITSTRGKHSSWRWQSDNRPCHFFHCSIDLCTVQHIIFMQFTHHFDSILGFDNQKKIWFMDIRVVISDFVNWYLYILFSFGYHLQAFTSLGVLFFGQFNHYFPPNWAFEIHQVRILTVIQAISSKIIFCPFLPIYLLHGSVTESGALQWHKRQVYALLPPILVGCWSMENIVFCSLF